jgi:hypothetical protein
LGAPGTCYCCGLEGHWTQECKKKLNDRPSRDTLELLKDLEELAAVADWDSMPSLMSMAKRALERLKYHKGAHDRIAKAREIFQGVN